VVIAGLLYGNTTEGYLNEMKEKLPKLTRKQKGFVKDYIETGNGVKSALNNYDTDDYNTAHAIASENLQKPAIVKSIQEALPDELLAQVHLEGLSATKRSGTGGMKIGIGADGQVNDFGHTEIDEPDFAVRHKYLDSAYKLKGSYAAEKSISITAQFNIENKEQVEGIALKVLEQMKSDEIV